MASIRCPASSARRRRAAALNRPNAPTEVTFGCFERSFVFVSGASDISMNVLAARADGGFFIPPATAAPLAAPAIEPFFASPPRLRILHLRRTRERGRAAPIAARLRE